MNKLPFLITLMICSIVKLNSQKTQMVLEGSIKVGNHTASNPAEGTIRWSGTDLEVMKAGSWISLTAGADVPPPGSLSDQDGNIYTTVSIGGRLWMAENLRTSKYRDGSSIALVPNESNWNSQTSGAFCWYDNDTGNENVYGKLYNWYAVDDPRGLCPSGWHVPTRIEWANMTVAVGGSSVAGGKLKEVGLAHWDNPNEGATDEFDFTALPGGIRVSSFTQEGRIGYHWTQEPSGSSAYYQYLRFNFTDVLESTAGKNHGLSVRCIKDN